MLSEKPAAPTLQQAEQLLAFHASLPQVCCLWAARAAARSSIVAMPEFQGCRRASQPNTAFNALNSCLFPKKTGAASPLNTQDKLAESRAGCKRLQHALCFAI